MRRAPRRPNRLVLVNADEDVVAELPRALQQVDVTRVEHVEGAVDVHDAGTGRDGPTPAVAELRHPPARRAEVRQFLAGLVPALVRPAALPRAQEPAPRLGTRREHPTHDIRRRYPLRALDRLEPSLLLGRCVRVGAVWEEARIVPVDDVVYAVLAPQPLHELGVDIVRHVQDHLVHPSEALHHRATLVLVQHGGTLAPTNLVVGDEADDELIAARLGLAQGVGVAEVREIKTSIHVYANGPPLPPSRGVSIQSPGGPRRQRASPDPEESLRVLVYGEGGRHGSDRHD